jgi:hypothetical protein
MIDRRSVPRITPKKPIKAKVRAYIPARVVDISLSGIQVELAQSLPPRLTCDLRFQVQDSEVVLRAIVRRCRVWGAGSDEKEQKVLLYRAGLQFDEASKKKVAGLGEGLGLSVAEAAGQAEGKTPPQRGLPGSGSGPGHPVNVELTPQESKDREGKD